MGYPMTYRRLVNRNNLREAEYGATLSGHNTKLADELTADKFNEGVNIEDVLRDTVRSLSQEIDRMNAVWSMLSGDLRRLERDTTDESVICHEIARKVGIDADVVAAVLKEWMAT